MPLLQKTGSMRPTQAGRLVVLLSTLIFIILCPSIVHAETGIIVYGSKGVDARRTATGHLALLITDLCANGIDGIRECVPGERNGVVLTRYGNLASNYKGTVIAIPLLDHFVASDDPDLVPLLSSGETLKAMQIQYWRKHLKPYFPALSAQRYSELLFERKKFDAARTVRQFLTLEFIGSMLSAANKNAPTEPIALMAPDTQEMIPDGRWREVIGAQHLRDSIIITVSASLDREMRLVNYVKQMQNMPFNVLSDNCSDFVEGALLTVFSDEKLRFRPRALDLANVWITSPISVATDFLKFANKEKLATHVSFMPMMAGTRRPSTSVSSVARGALVPDPSQGKIAFGLKTYINTLNPLLGATALTVDKASRFADLSGLIRERGGEGLSELANEMMTQSAPRQELARLQQRERVRTFGSQSCWDGKKTQFTKLASQAEEMGILTPGERRLILRQGRPFLLPRFYERIGSTDQTSLMAGVRESVSLSREYGILRFASIMPGRVSTRSSPTAAEIRTLLASHEATNAKMAFKVMAAVINYDLSSEPVHRRVVEAFDQDWLTLLEAARENSIHLETGDASGQTLEICSCREFDEGRVQLDALSQSSTFFHRAAEEGRALLFSPVR